MPEHQDLLLVAILAAQRAAEYIRSVDRPPDSGAWALKGTSDFVTQVDRDAEQMIAETLLAEYPGSSVLGEELTPDQRVGDLVWIVDPLDGTTNFLHAYPAFAVSIAAMVHDQLSAGVVINVPQEGVYHATAGGGAWCGERRLSVSDTDDIAHALIASGFPFKALDRLPQ